MSAVAAELDTLDESRDETRARTSRTSELVIAAAVLALGVLVVVQAAQIHTAVNAQILGPRWWPTVLGYALIAGAAVLTLQAFLRVAPSEESSITRNGLMTLLGLGALIVAYGIAWQFIDFIVVTPVLLAGMVAIAGGRGLKALVLFPVITTAVLYGIFGALLRVPL